MRRFNSALALRPPPPPPGPQLTSRHSVDSPRGLSRRRRFANKQQSEPRKTNPVLLQHEVRRLRKEVSQLKQQLAAARQPRPLTGLVARLMRKVEVQKAEIARLAGLVAGKKESASKPNGGFGFSFSSTASTNTKRSSFEQKLTTKRGSSFQFAFSSSEPTAADEGKPDAPVEPPPLVAKGQRSLEKRNSGSAAAVSHIRRQIAAREKSKAKKRAAQKQSPPKIKSAEPSGIGKKTDIEDEPEPQPHGSGHGGMGMGGFRGGIDPGQWGGMGGMSGLGGMGGPLGGMNGPMGFGDLTKKSFTEKEATSGIGGAFGGSGFGSSKAANLEAAGAPAPRSSLFGGAPAPSPSPFGAPTSSSSPFGGAPAAAGGFGFGAPKPAASAPAFGAAFGAPVPSPGPVGGPPVLVPCELAEAAHAGAKLLELTEHMFRLGDQLVVSRGKATEEVVQALAWNRPGLILRDPLQHDHGQGEVVELMGARESVQPRCKAEASTMSAGPPKPQFSFAKKGFTVEGTDEIFSSMSSARAAAEELFAASQAQAMAKAEEKPKAGASGPLFDLAIDAPVVPSSSSSSESSIAVTVRYVVSSSMRTATYMVSPSAPLAELRRALSVDEELHRQVDDAARKAKGKGLRRRRRTRMGTMKKKHLAYMLRVPGTGTLLTHSDDAKSLRELGIVTDSDARVLMILRRKKKAELVLSISGELVRGRTVQVRLKPRARPIALLKALHRLGVLDVDALNKEYGASFGKEYGASFGGLFAANPSVQRELPDFSSSSSSSASSDEGSDGDQSFWNQARPTHVVRRGGFNPWLLLVTCTAVTKQDGQPLGSRELDMKLGLVEQGVVARTCLTISLRRSNVAPRPGFGLGASPSYNPYPFGCNPGGDGGSGLFQRQQQQHFGVAGGFGSAGGFGGAGGFASGGPPKYTPRRAPGNAFGSNPTASLGNAGSWGPAAPAYSPTSPTYSPTSPTYSPTSPDFSPPGPAPGVPSAPDFSLGPGSRPGYGSSSSTYY